MSSEFTSHLQSALRDIAPALQRGGVARVILAYGGDAATRREHVDVVPWSAL